MKRTCALARDTARSALAHRVKVLRGHVQAAAAHDPDGIHDLRVASRRLRAVLEDHARFYRKRPLKRFRKRVRAITRGLGKARELDVALDHLRALKKDAPEGTEQAVRRIARMLRKLRTEESNAVDESCTLARSAEFRSALRELQDSGKDATFCFLRQTRATLRRRYAALAKSYKGWKAGPSDEALHQVRIAFKKLRYSCEIAGHLYGKPMDEFIERMKAAQETLGDWNDTRVLRDYVAACAEQDGDSRGAYATLEGLCDAKARHLLDDFVRLAPSFFESDEQSRAKRLFAKPNTKCCKLGRRRTHHAQN